MLKVRWGWNRNVKPVLRLLKKESGGFKEVWSASSPMPVPPAAAHITNDGRYVVLQDEWGHHGLGIVFAFLDPKGHPLKSYGLPEIVNTGEISPTLRTVSNLWWDVGAQIYFRNQDSQLAVITEAGTIRLFDLATGQQAPVPASVAQQVRQERIPLARKSLTSPDAMKRVTAAYNLASLKDRESIPQLIRLLNDGYCTYFMQYQYPGLKDGRYRNFPVQLASGEALVRLLGPASIPHLERKLNLRDPIMYDYWCEMIAEAGGPGALHVFDRLLKSGKRVQERYITQALDKDDGTFARDHKDLVRKLRREF